MSVKYVNNTVVGTNDNIDDGTPSTDKVYSSDYVQRRIDYMQQQIEALIVAAKGVRDVVGTKAELDAYPTDTLTVDDIINVLSDETRSNANVYYRWNGQEFEYIGDIGTYYTKIEFNELIDKKQYTLESGQNIKTINGESVLGQGDLQLPVDSETYYPIGYVYMTISDTNPADLFGGTWEEIKGHSLYAKDDTHPIGEIGGEEMHTLTTNELSIHGHTSPAHNHSATVDNGVRLAVWATPPGTKANGIPVARGVTSLHSDGGYDDMKLFKGSSSQNKRDVDWVKCYSNGGWDYATVTCGYNTRESTAGTGNSQPHDNMPPYYVCHIWKRIA